MQGAQKGERPRDTASKMRVDLASGRILQEQLIKAVEIIDKCRVGDSADALAGIFRDIAELLQAEIAVETCKRCYDGGVALVPAAPVDCEGVPRPGSPPRWTDGRISDAVTLSLDGRTILKVEVNRFVACHYPSGDQDAVCLLGNRRSASKILDSQLLVIYLLPHLHAMYLRAGCALQGKPDTESEAILTRREIEVLQWVALGKTNWEIAQIMHISERTVKYHLSNTLNKTGVVNRAQAVLKGNAMGVLSGAKPARNSSG